MRQDKPKENQHRPKRDKPRENLDEKDSRVEVAHLKVLMRRYTNKVPEFARELGISLTDC